MKPTVIRATRKIALVLGYVLVSFWIIVLTLFYYMRLGFDVYHSAQ